MNKIGILLFVLFCAVTACEDEETHLTVPFSPVSFRIDLNGRDYRLKIPLSFSLFTEKDRTLLSDRFGYGGLLVVSDATGSAIYAYDLSCPHEDSKVVQVVPADDGKAVCPSCGSVFVTLFGYTNGDGSMVGFGSVDSGPATEPLQRYWVMPLRDEGSYRITN